MTAGAGAVQGFVRRISGGAVEQAAEEAAQQAGKETAQQAAKELAEETGEQAGMAATPLAHDNRVNVDVHAPKGIGPDDAAPEGFSFDIDNPIYRQLKDGDQVLQYSLKGKELAVDWVEGGGAASMLKRILGAEGSGVRRISGYTADKLGGLSDNALLIYGNQLAANLGEGWRASIEFVDKKRFIVFTR